MKKIASLLIVNRGEIAIRIAKTASRLGIRTYGLLTAQEPNALYLEKVDEVVDVSDDLSGKVFLNIERIIAEANRLGIEAIHPGYGFLSENPELAQACKENDILFIGPSAEVIRLMGDKEAARQQAELAKVPVLPASESVVKDATEAGRIASEIGFPVIIKAVAGGGGKGMRIVRQAEELERMYRIASNEAQSAFGNASVFIEKYLENPRHIEIQVLADKHGAAINLCERECSIQRKHQKLLEEAPSSYLNQQQRKVLGDDAVRLCRQVGYDHIGTVEFLMDDAGHHYFMEMNTRIQVEHPVTESIVGVDLVEQQLLVAQGYPMQLKQEDIKINGWAMELRINAEDVQTNFAPDFGVVEKQAIPACDYLRCDSGYKAGKVIPDCFDSLIAKLIIHGKDRADVIEKALKVLEEVQFEGVKNTVPFFKALLNHPEFVKGNYNTSFLETQLTKPYWVEEDEEQAAALLAMQAYLNHIETVKGEMLEHKQMSAWKQSRQSMF
ncbi:ATP-grasp domain-containing protein [Marinilabiliaceae bacterium JC017]|nr:ATP-grasp domain-containing protein [Marinilabiliaceae bacterium JC017]